MSASIKYNDWLLEQLKDAEFASEYLNAASEDDDPKTYLTALRQVVEARGGMATVAEKAHYREKRCTAHSLAEETPPSKHSMLCSKRLA